MPTPASSGASTRSIAIKTGRVEGVASGESEGFGVRVLVDGAWGFASSHILTDGRGGPRRRRGRPDRPAPAPPPCANPVVLDRSAAGARARYETPVEEDPFKVPLERKIADLLAADQAASQGQGHRLHRVDVRGRSANGRRSPPPTAASPSRSSPTSARRSRRTPSTATSTSGGAIPDSRRRLERGRLRVHPRPRPRRAAPSRSPTRRSRCSPRRSARPAGSRSSSTRRQLYLQVHEIVRPPDRARPRLRDRGVLRRAPASSPRTSSTTASATAPTSSTSSPTRPRPAAWARSAGTTRASRPRPCRWSRTGIFVGLPVSRARPRRGSAGRAAARCARTAGTASRSSA